MTFLILNNSISLKELMCVYKGEQYSVREDGSVLRHPRDGKKPRPLDNQWTFGKINVHTGYLEIVSITIHRIVATAFHGEAPTLGHVVDHKDTNKQNNRPDNLRWVTRFENIMLNPITVKRIEYVIGCGIEEFLKDPTKFRNKFQDQNFAWMRSVSAEEGKLTLERLQYWAASDKKPSGGTLGEWIYNRGSWYDDVSQIMSSNTSNASQRNWMALYDFPFCPPSFDGDPIASYNRRLGLGNAFAASQNKISVAYRKTISENGSILYVIAEWQYSNSWVLAKITYGNEQFVHENLGTFPKLEGAERALAELQGKEWPPVSSGEEVFNSEITYDYPGREQSNITASKTPGAVQRNWKMVSEFPRCPQEVGEQSLLAYEVNLKVGDIFCSNNYFTSTVHKTAFTADGQSLFVITKSGSDIKPWAIGKITFENGLFVHESIGTFFEERGTERMLCKAQGQEWTGEDGIDDYC